MTELNPNMTLQSLSVGPNRSVNPPLNYATEIILLTYLLTYLIN